jgi:hypothetical protein
MRFDLFADENDTFSKSAGGLIAPARRVNDDISYDA